jgi:addiction module antidote protein HigA
MVTMTNKIVEYKDLIAFHPGQYVEELIEDYNVTQKEFAERLGISEMKLYKLVNGEESISNDIARKLANITNISMQTWFNLQNAYDVKIAEIVKQK